MLVFLKTPEEVDGFARAGRIAGQILGMLMSKALPGVTTGDLDKLARQECERFSVKPAFLGYRSFPAAICASVNEELVHGIPGGRILLEGDTLSVDIGVDLDGFIGDVAETIVVGGEPTPLVLACRSALMAGATAAVEGHKLGDIGFAIKTVAERTGFAVVSDYGGHGIDRGRLHASPFVPNAPAKEGDLRLRAGMVLAVEPMFVDAPNGKTRVMPDRWTVVAGGISAHCEHTLVVGKQYADILTQVQPSTYDPKTALVVNGMVTQPIISGGMPSADTWQKGWIK